MMDDKNFKLEVCNILRDIVVQLSDDDKHYIEDILRDIRDLREGIE